MHKVTTLLSSCSRTNLKSTKSTVSWANGIIPRTQTWFLALLCCLVMAIGSWLCQGQLCPCCELDGVDSLCHPGLPPWLRSWVSWWSIHLDLLESYWRLQGTYFLAQTPKFWPSMHCHWLTFLYQFTVDPTGPYLVKRACQPSSKWFHARGQEESYSKTTSIRGSFGIRYL